MPLRRCSGRGLTARPSTNDDVPRIHAARWYRQDTAPPSFRAVPPSLIMQACHSCTREAEHAGLWPRRGRSVTQRARTANAGQPCDPGHGLPGSRVWRINCKAVVSGGTGYATPARLEDDVGGPRSCLPATGRDGDMPEREARHQKTDRSQAGKLLLPCAN